MAQAEIEKLVNQAIKTLGIDDPSESLISDLNQITSNLIRDGKLPPLDVLIETYNKGGDGSDYGQVAELAPTGVFSAPEVVEVEITESDEDEDTDPDTNDSDEDEESEDEDLDDEDEDDR